MPLITRLLTPSPCPEEPAGTTCERENASWCPAGSGDFVHVLVYPDVNCHATFSENANSPHRQTCLLRRCGLLARETNPVSTSDRVSRLSLLGTALFRAGSHPGPYEPNSKRTTGFATAVGYRLFHCLLSWIRVAGECSLYSSILRSLPQLSIMGAVSVPMGEHGPAHPSKPLPRQDFRRERISSSRASGERGGTRTHTVRLQRTVPLDARTTT